MATILRKDQLQTNVKQIDNQDQLFYKEVKDNQVINEPYSLRLALRKALATTYKDEENLSGDKKLERFMLAQKIWQADGDVELKPDEVTLIKDCVRKLFPIEAIGYINDVIDKAKS